MYILLLPALCTISVLDYLIVCVYKFVLITFLDFVVCLPQVQDPKM